MLRGIFLSSISATEYVSTLFPDRSGSTDRSLHEPRPSGPEYHWPTDYTADVQPVACHSHNDYWRPVPARSAIEAGCTGIEADVWLLGDELYVGHSRSSLTAQRTFRSLYVDPLLEILGGQNPSTTFHPTADTPRNGVYDTNSEQTLVQLIDFKTDGHELWRFVQEQLEPLREREYLTHFNGSHIIQGPVTVVVTGNAPFDKVIENTTYRDMFYDAPLETMEFLADRAEDPSRTTVVHNPEAERAYLSSLASAANSTTAIVADPSVYTPSNSYYSSTSFLEHIGTPLPFLSSSQIDLIRAHIAGAHRQGLKVRYWDTPAWPIGLRNYVWHVLVREGVDYLNVDDLEAATRRDWEKGTQGTLWSGMARWGSRKK